MKISIVFVFVLVVLSAFMGQTEAKWKGWKKIERAGQRVFKAAEKALPVVQGYAVAITSPSSAQMFGGRQNFPSGGFSQQAGYKAGPVWGSLSQSFDRHGFGSPINVGAGADYMSKQGHGISGSLGVVPGVGGQGSLRGQVGILNSGNHHVNAFAQHDRFLNRDLKPFGPETNSAGLNYNNANGANAFISGSQTHGAPARGTVGGSIPLVSSGNAGINLSGQTTFGHGMKPQHQVGVEGSIRF
ncbi:hypothetical protein RN001_009661 [Aquatica leii]|uniref:Uncharacterized protein n=1 Tax=Aquatica leii TaxID=1421715 RepID=A0AAN7SQ10_9COLE|nr:hypothetical protein RN001_009661 [Aquatica leii]